MRSTEEIKDFVYASLKDADVIREVSGTLSKTVRPAGSDREDVVISVLANEGCGQVQTAYVNVNVYVPDVWREETGEWIEDTARVRELASLSKSMFTLRGDEYHAVAKYSTQNVMEAGATFEDGHTEHFINNKIYIEISND